MRYLITLIICSSLSLLACKSEVSNTQQPDQSTKVKVSIQDQGQQRIVSLSGFLTEVLYKLGYGDQIVGTDITSVYPEAAATLPKLGHVSQLNAEAILQLRPDIIFIEQAQVNRTAILDQIKDAGIAIVTINTSRTLDNTLKAAKQLQGKLNISADKMEQLAMQMQLDSAKLVQQVAKSKERPTVLFIYARGAGRLMVSGTNTSAAAIIEKAGGRNAIQSFEDFKPLTPEALIEAAPDVILMFTSGLASLDGKEGLAQIKGIDQTPAFKNDRIVAMDGHYLTAFGPRAAQAAIELSQRIMPKDSE
ncbi:MAG: helical backbone metal receptor [Bacteroidota bacterium]